MDTGEVKHLTSHIFTQSILFGKSRINNTCFHRLPRSVARNNESGELSRITFVFDTICSADCRFVFLAVRDRTQTQSIPARRHMLLEQSSSVNIYACKCKCVPLQGYSQWNNDVIELWTGNNSKQSYSYLVQSIAATSFTWSFQRTGKSSEVSPNLPSPSLKHKFLK